ncbi:MAG: hypothetical protein RR563_05565 [Acinetobacter sp.]
MKNIFLALILAFPMIALATPVKSIRTSFDFIEVGDQESQVRSKLGRAQSTDYYVMRDSNDRPRAATDLTYVVDGEKYIVTIVNGVVYKIEWVR